MLKWLRALHLEESRHKQVQIPNFVKKDVIWWYKFLPIYNGFLSCYMKNGVNQMKFVLVIPVYKVAVVTGKGNIFILLREILQ